MEEIDSTQYIETPFENVIPEFGTCGNDQPVMNLESSAEVKIIKEEEKLESSAVFNLAAGSLNTPVSKKAQKKAN